jgi:hypothetical protein
MVNHRPVHYAAATTRGMVFSCYDRELQQHVDSGREDGARFRKVYSMPAPLRHTDLSKVTCPECWRAIAKMAQELVEVEEDTP